MSSRVIDIQLFLYINLPLFFKSLNLLRTIKILRIYLAKINKILKLLTYLRGELQMKRLENKVIIITGAAKVWDEYMLKKR